MEFGAYKLGITEAKNLSWEFASQMRPAIQPAMVYVAHKSLAWIGVESPFVIAFLFRLLAAALSFLSIHLLIRAFYDKIVGEKLKVSFLLLSFFLWFLVFNDVRFSSENMGGHLFVAAFALFFIWEKPSRIQYFLMGTVLGLSFIFRYQNAFLIAGWLLWLLFINKLKFSDLLLTASGIVLLFFFGIAIDRWFYGEWVLSTWKYFEENILLGKMASGWGEQPWYDYLVQIFNIGIPPFSLLYIVPFILVVIYRWKDAVVWTVLPFVLIHVYISHKELRFLFPALGLLPLIIVKAGEIVNEKWPNLFQNKLFKIVVVLFWIQNGIFTLIVSLKSADNQVDIYEEIYNRYDQPVVLYYTNDNPYTRALDVYYYRRANVTTRHINAVEEIRVLPDTTVLFATVSHDEDAIVHPKNKQIFSALPEWVKAFNVFDWVERTRFWTVYEIQNPPSKK